MACLDHLLFNLIQYITSIERYSHVMKAIVFWNEKAVVGYGYVALSPKTAKELDWLSFQLGEWLDSRWTALV